jgi:hypothetical protein
VAPIDWGALLSIAPQLATAIAFGYFVLKLLERQDKQNDKRDVEWREYLSIGRDQYVESVTAMTSEVKSLATAVTATHSAMTLHDSWSHAEAVRTDALRTATAAAVAAEAVRVAAEVAAQTVTTSLKRKDDK